MVFGISLFLNSCSSGGTTTNNLSSYQRWITQLTSSNYSVAEGNVYLMQNTECPTFVSVFNSCFGQNPASPYIIPQPPIEQSYVDPYYATGFTTQGPDGPTNIFYRLGNNDALITVISYPPEAAYLGYQSYVFTSESSNYVGINPPRSRVISPDPSRYDIFGSIGNDINSIIVQNTYGTAPWNGNTIMYITTPNQNLANALIASAKNYGINHDSIFIEPVGSNVITGNGANADDMLTLMRYAVPENATSATSWENNLSPVANFAINQYSGHTTNTPETTLSTGLQQLSILLQTYLEEKQLSSPIAISAQTQATTVDNSNGVPTSGLVGSFCIQYGTNCEGDNQDTSTYATLTESSIILGADETVFVAGVNHSIPNVNNNHYLSIDIYNATNSSGVAGSSQTNTAAAGFASGVLTGSAEQVLTDLGISIPPADTELTANIASLYVTFVSRNCNNATIASASNYCISLQGTSLWTIPA